MNDKKIIINTLLASYLPDKRNLESLSALEVRGVFLALYRHFQQFKLSLDDFSVLCGRLLAYTRDNHIPSDVLWAELEDVLDYATELSWSKKNEGYEFNSKKIADYIENLDSSVSVATA